MTKKTTVIIALQTILIVTLVWLLAFYGRDEYEQQQLSAQDDADVRSNVVEQDGLQVVSINAATQKNSGIEVKPLNAFTYQGKTKALGTVVSIQTLVDYSSQYQSLLAQLSIAESGLPNHQLQYQRFKQLNDDDKNISDKAVQEAYALVLADQVAIKTTQQQLSTLKSTIEAQWGSQLSALITQKNPPDALKALLTQKSVLVQVSFPLNEAPPRPASTLTITPIHDHAKPIRATFISQSIQSDISVLGKTYYFTAPADDLRVGMRVNVVPEQLSQQRHHGVIVPNEAIVWNAGLAWVYVKTDEQHFLRKPVAVNAEIDGGWFDESLPSGTQVVVNGAQLLLSEEFKFLIKNENDD